MKYVLPETVSDRAAKQRALALLAGASCAIRLIYSDAVYLQNTGNAGWIQIIGGTLLAAPSLWIVVRLMNEADANGGSNRMKKAVCAAFVPFFSFDCSSWVFSLAESSSYTTFADESFYLLYLPALLTAMVISSRGANACGGLARGATLSALFLISLTMILQIDQMHPIWLTPILGGGPESLLRGSALCGGYAALYPAGIWLFLQDEDGKIEGTVRKRMIKALPLAGLAAIVFLLLYGMLSPNIPYAPHIRSFALERLLTGGGRSTSVHFPALLAWYIMLLITVVYSMFCTSTALRLLFPQRSLLFCSVVTAILSAAWTPVRMFWKHGEDFLVFANVLVVTFGMLLLYIQIKVQNRRRRNADR